MVFYYSPTYKCEGDFVKTTSECLELGDAAIGVGQPCYFSDYYYSCQDVCDGIPVSIHSTLLRKCEGFCPGKCSLCC